MDAAAIAPAVVRARPVALICGLSLGLAAVSLLLPSTPSYDPWAWLIWGRELAGGGLDTSAGPAWKPLPVLVSTLLAPLAAAPELWLLLARAAAIAGVLLAGLLAWRLSGRVAAGVIASVSLLFVAGVVRNAALGFSEPLLVALLAGSALAHLDGRRRLALALGALAALLRPEVWPFLIAYGVVLWRRGEARALAVSAALAVPALWFLPELWGSGELLRSTERARVPNPGQPALAALPALEVLKRFALMTPPLATLGLALGLRGPTRLVAASALSWVALVALMSQAGFSGEERYLLPAAAAACVVAGAAWSRLLHHRAAALALVAIALLPLPFVVSEAVDLRRDLADDAALAEGLRDAIAAAGGAEALRCGDLAAGRYRFPLVAWHLDVPISAVGFTLDRPGVVLASELRRGEPRAPMRPAGGRLLAAGGTWRIWSTCDA
jgi:hypothetical protein